VQIIDSPRKDESDVSGKDLLTDERRLFEELCTKHWLAAGFRRVVASHAESLITTCFILDCFVG